MQIKGPDRDNRSVRSRFDVTAFNSPQIPHARSRTILNSVLTENRGFNQIKKFLRQITPQNKLYYFSEKHFLMLGAL